MERLYREVPGDSGKESDGKRSKPERAGPRGLFNRWTFDQQKPGEPPAGFSMLEFGEGPAADWTIKADIDAPSASNILAVKSSCQALSCYPSTLRREWVA